MRNDEQPFSIILSNLKYIHIFGYLEQVDNKYISSKICDLSKYDLCYIKTNCSLDMNREDNYKNTLFSFTI